jgi:L-lactate dehydrogenase complex protein LldG
MNNATLLDTFIENAEQVQARVHTFASDREVVGYAIRLAIDRKINCLACAGLGTQLLQLLDEQCERSGIERIASPFRSQPDKIRMTLTTADWGIADTGSLVIHSESEDLRIATMLSDTHIAILAGDRIVSGLDQLEKILGPVLKSGHSCYAAMITGPSRTADIERILAIGVHGPQELHVLIWGSVRDER